MSSLFNQSKINSLPYSVYSKNNTNILANTISSEIYSLIKSENTGFRKIHSFPLIIKVENSLIELSEAKKGKYLNEYFNKIRLFLSKNKDVLFNFFKFIFNKTNYQLKIKINEKKTIDSICLFYINPKTNINKKEMLVINKNNSISFKCSSTISSLPKNKNNKGNNSIINFEYSIKNYCNYIPKRKEMRETAGKIPCHFPIECYHGINQIHNDIGKKEFLNLSEKNTFSMKNDSYKSIDKKDHLLLNHLCLKFSNKNIINSFTFKYRHKNATFVYYK